MSLQDEELDYGEVSVPVDLPEQDNGLSADSDNYDTLIEVQKTLHSFKDKLFGDFNTFNIDPDDDEDEQVRKLKDDLRIRQGIWALMEPEIEKVDNAISAVKIKRNY